MRIIKIIIIFINIRCLPGLKIILKCVSTYSEPVGRIALSAMRMAHCGHVGHGGALVETTPFDQRVVGSNPALAAM